MKQLIWLLMLAGAAALGYWAWLARFMAEAQLAARQVKPASPKAPDTAGPG